MARIFLRVPYTEIGVGPGFFTSTIYRERCMARIFYEYTEKGVWPGFFMSKQRKVYGQDFFTSTV